MGKLLLTISAIGSLLFMWKGYDQHDWFKIACAGIWLLDCGLGRIAYAIEDLKEEE